MKGKMASNSEWKKSFFFIKDKRSWEWNLASRKDEDLKDVLSDVGVNSVDTLEEMAKWGWFLRFEESVSNQNVRKHGLLLPDWGASSSV